MHPDSLERRKREILIRSTRERLGLLDSLDSVRRNAVTGVAAVRSSAMGAVKGVGLLGAAAGGAAVLARVAKGMLFSRKKAALPVKGDWRWMAVRQVATVLLVPLVKEYLVKRTVRAALPRPAATAPEWRRETPVKKNPVASESKDKGGKKTPSGPGGGVSVRIRKLPFLARHFSVRRFFIRLLGQ